MSNKIQDKKYHFIYKTTNLLNGKYYYGMHSTSNLKDGYIGSGKRLRSSIRKYGIENFKCEIIEFLSDRETLAVKEREIVNLELINDSLCMNLIIGGLGSGGWTKAQSCNGAKIMLEKIWSNPEFRKRASMRSSVTLKRLWTEGKITPYDWTGKKQTETHKQNFKVSIQGKQKGELNSQFGKRWNWISNGIETKKIKPDELQSYLENGWIKGKKINTVI